MSGKDWSGPRTDIKVLFGAEAIRKRPGFYGLTDEQVEVVSDEDLNAVAALYEQKTKAESRLRRDGTAGLPTGGHLTEILAAEDALTKLLSRVVYDPTIPDKCPRCGSPTQSTPLTPPDEGVAYGCTRCPWPNPPVPDLASPEQQEALFRVMNERVVHYSRVQGTNPCEEIDLGVHDLMTLYTQAPEGRVEYHQQGKLTLYEFGRLWMAESQPSLRYGWQDPGDGWVRWIWFKDKGGKAHVLHVLSYRDNPASSAKDLQILGFFLGRLMKDNPRPAEPPSDLDRELEEIL